MSEVNPNEVIGAALAEVIKASFKDVKGIGGTTFEKLAFNLRAGFQQYYQRTYERYSTLKTLIHKNKAVSFDSLYVPLRLERDTVQVSDDALVSSIGKSTRIVVTGTGGTGKSMFMRFALLKFLRGGTKRIPIFLELRTITNLEKPVSILHAIQTITPALRVDSSDAVAEHGLKKGAFILLLDGFDEIDPSVREEYERQISDLSRDYPNCPIVISGRPNERFAAWPEFDVYRVQPMMIEETKLLIGKLDAEPLLKKRFLEAVDGGLWTTHSEFLSIPLLATLMLMTFSELADIPTKMHVFYRQAFEVLFARHDATKNYYTRKTFSGLPLDSFETLFGAFCFMSYYDGKLSLDKSSALKYIERAANLEKIKVERTSFLKDLEESVCILITEGLELIFVHRTFQEYFSARFISDNQQIDIERALSKIAQRGAQERCIPILYDLNPGLVNAKWALPQTSLMVDHLEKVDVASITEYAKASGRHILLVSNYIGLVPSDTESTFNSLSLLKRVYKFRDPEQLNDDLPFFTLPDGLVDEVMLQRFGKTRSGKRPRKTEERLSSLVTGKADDDDVWLSRTPLLGFIERELQWLKSLSAQLASAVSERSASLDEILGSAP